jgi:hypothetical protein
MKNCPISPHLAGKPHAPAPAGIRRVMAASGSMRLRLLLLLLLLHLLLALLQFLQEMQQQQQQQQPQPH